MFGFMSTSKKQNVAEKFLDKRASNQYLFVIDIPELAIASSY